MILQMIPVTQLKLTQPIRFCSTFLFMAAVFDFSGY